MMFGQALNVFDPNKLNGKWEGNGTVMVHGKEIPFKESIEFKLMKIEPYIIFNYQQFTKHAENGKSMHAENSFWKALEHF